MAFETTESGILIPKIMKFMSNQLNFKYLKGSWKDIKISGNKAIWD